MKFFLITLRLFKNYRLYSVVNTIGLALSLACVITISRYLYSELSVDTMHSKHRNIYGIISQDLNSTTRSQYYCMNINNVVDFTDITLDPSVLAKTMIIRSENETVTIDNKDYTVNIMSIDTSFTRIFDFTTTIGSLAEVESSVDKAAITPQTAIRMFGNENPLGKAIKLKNKSYTITAIITEPTSKTSMAFDVIVPTVRWDEWMQIGHEYLLMPDNFDYKAFNDKYSKYQIPYIGSPGLRFLITPLDNLYFDNSIVTYKNAMSLTGDKNALRVIFAVAILVLIIGIFNFVNIYTILMLRRSREVGVKKVFGASTASITWTIYAENLTMVAFSVALGWVVSLIFKDFTESTLGIPAVDNLQFNILLTAAFVITLPLLTTIYPYIKYRYAKPITSLREVNNGNRSIVSRATFLVLQYSITIMMVIVSVYFSCQMKYILNADLGYKHEGIISTQLFVDKESTMFNDADWEERKKRKEQIKHNYKLMCDELSKNPIVKQFSINESPHTILPNDDFIKMKLLPDGEFMNVAIFGCGANFFSMYEIEKTAGRLWSDSTDRLSQYLCIVNEAFIRDFKIKDYTTAVVQTNRRIWFGFSDTEEGMNRTEQNPPYQIVGIVRDFQIGHLKSRITPLVIYYSSDNNEDIDPRLNKLMVKAAPGETAEVIKLLEGLHEKFGNGEFTYTMVDDEIAQQYEQDRKVTNIYTTFAMIAIIIGSLGLFSLSLYDVQQRYREIALRRVNGATVTQILTLLLRKYYILLGIAFVIAAPISYLAIEWYMRDFANKIELSWWIYAIAAFITAAISILTLIYQTLKAAATNPAVAIKSE